MSKTKKRWLIAIVSFLVAGAIAVVLVANHLAKRFDPLIREQAVAYLRERFDSEVELASLRVRMPKIPPLRLLFHKANGAVARVEGEGISMRYRGAHDSPPIFSIRKFRFDVNLASLLETRRIVPIVFLEGVEIHIPPKEERRPLSQPRVPGQPTEHDADEPSSVLIQQVTMKDARLTLLPRDKTRVPYEFVIPDLQLTSVGSDIAMKYDATITNPKPRGLIRSQGTFGPWSAGEPGNTPLSGHYNFTDADLGVFSAIAGTLQSTGTFGGSLSSLHVSGEASVPNFRLKRSGNPVPLTTRFDALVDGTNGDTVLKPVNATLGRTNFTTSGAILKHEAENRREIRLDVLMPRGRLQDVLTLASKGTPFMEGAISLRTKIILPPSAAKVRKKLILDGSFGVAQGKFLRSRIQDQIDGLSRRAQGQPKNQEIDEVVSNMKGSFHLEDEVIAFRSLAYDVPGAAIQLAGNYDMGGDRLDFHGSLKLKARLSQTVTGWKRWALKPVDPFFAKEGAGTFLRIKVEGSSKEPKFGLDRGNRSQPARQAAGKGR